MKKVNDIIVIGGGIVGIAVAKIHVENKNISLSVIEAENGLSKQQSSNNSGVIHSGLY